VCRADARIGARLQEVTRQQPLPDLLTDKEREIVKGLSDTFVEDYINWAKSRGDAAWQYHEAGAFVILSQLLSGVVKLPTSFGIIVPNLWFMILADTTLTRKSTAMDMAVEMVLQVDPDAVLATDGSLEGLMTGLAARPNRPGIFWRDEFSGLLEMIRKKDYYAGMIESMTKLYDGKYQKRMLRKEVLEIRDPILIFFCGGIRTRVLALMDIEYVYSGFLPRFIFIEAASNIDNYRPIGPMTERQDDTRQKLVQDLSRLREMYTADVIVKIGEQTVTTKRQWEAALDEPTWDRYNAFEQAMLKYGTESGAPEIYTPVMDRLSKSTLKASMLLAACRQEPVGNVKVEMGDLLRAISYCEHWRVHNLDVAANVGKTSNEKQLDQMLTAITREPGVPRSKLMQNYHLTAREADWILETLDQRGTIRRTKNGRSERLYPALIKG
jgi:ribosomal protein S25